MLDGIPIDRIKIPLIKLWSSLKTGKEGPPFERPLGHGYDEEAELRELRAEAGRALFFDPNWVKTRFPEVAEVFRDAIAKDERLRQIFRLNTLLLGTVGAGQLFGEEEPRS
jgi:hypothetical protein